VRNENSHEGKSEQAEGVEQREPSYIQHSAAFRSLAERTVGQGEKGNLAQLASGREVSLIRRVRK
jgi:hypothetical protein